MAITFSGERTSIDAYAKFFLFQNFERRRREGSPVKVVVPLPTDNQGRFFLTFDRYSGPLPSIWFPNHPTIDFILINVATRALVAGALT